MARWWFPSSVTRAFIRVSWLLVDTSCLGSSAFGALDFVLHYHELHCPYLMLWDVVLYSSGALHGDAASCSRRQTCRSPSSFNQTLHTQKHTQRDTNTGLRASYIPLYCSHSVLILECSVPPRNETPYLHYTPLFPFKVPSQSVEARYVPSVKHTTCTGKKQRSAKMHIFPVQAKEIRPVNY